jgi:hypothetical protein
VDELPSAGSQQNRHAGSSQPPIIGGKASANVSGFETLNISMERESIP